MLDIFSNVDTKDMDAVMHLINRIQTSTVSKRMNKNIYSITFDFLPLILDRLLNNGKPLSAKTFKEAVKLSKEFAIEFETEFNK